MTSQTRWLPWQIGVGAVVLVLGCSPGDDRSGQELASAPAPRFDVERLDGSRLNLEDLRGQTVLLDFWATWCAPCVLEIPELNAVWERVAERDVQILALSIDSLPREEVADWAREKGVRYPVAMADLDLAIAYGTEQFPYHVLIGPGGQLLERLPPGFHDADELLDLLERHGAM